MKTQFFYLWIQFHISLVVFSILTGYLVVSLSTPGIPDTQSQEISFLPYILAIFIEAPVSFALCYHFFYKRSWDG